MQSHVSLQKVDRRRFYKHTEKKVTLGTELRVTQTQPENTENHQKPEEAGSGSSHSLWGKHTSQHRHLSPVELISVSGLQSYKKISTWYFKSLSWCIFVTES